MINMPPSDTQTVASRKGSETPSKQWRVKMTENKTVYVKAKALAFRHHGVQSYVFAVDQYGHVRVYDDVAGFYTSCHILNHHDKDMIRKLAEPLFAEKFDPEFEPTARTF